MIDTIKGYLDLSDKKKEDIGHLIDNCQCYHNGFTSNYVVEVSNFKIRISTDINGKPLRLNFEGSLPKFYFGNNLSTLDSNSCELAVQMLSDNLNIDIAESTVTRLDFGTNISLQESISEYTSSLVSYRNYRTSYYPESRKSSTSKTFTSVGNSKTLCFYDKKGEIVKRKNCNSYLPNEFRDMNILRYELRIQKNLAKSLGMKRVILNEIFKKNFHLILGRMWLNMFSNIDKQFLGNNPTPLIYTRNGFLKYLSYFGIEKLGYEKVLDIIRNLDFDIKNPNVKRSKLKYLIRDIQISGTKLPLEHNLSVELINKIYNSYKLIQ